MTWTPGDISSSTILTDADHLYPVHINELRQKFDIQAINDGYIYNVKDYGALGNGTTDDVIAIQAAMTACAATGGIVFFPKGTYKITAGLTASGILDVTLLGQAISKINNVNTSLASAITINPGGVQSGRQITLQNLQIYGNPLSGHGVRVLAESNLTIDHCTIFDHGKSGVNCETGAYTGFFINSQFNSNGLDGVNLDADSGNGTRFVGCNFIGNDTTAMAGCRIGPSYGTTFYSCDFEGNDIGIITGSSIATSVYGTYFEGNVTREIYLINQDASSINGNTFIGGTIEIYNSEAVVLTGNNFSGLTVSLTGTMKNHIIGPNSLNGTCVLPNASSMYEMVSTTQGFMPPQMTGTQRDAITSPAEGLIVFNLSSHKLNYRNNSTWVEL